MSDRRSSGLSFTESQSQSTQNTQESNVLSSIRENYGYIESLTISNFKSYYGETKIGPFSPFTCIIGPNGSGKSNLMDAISFVLGVKTQQLRGKKLTDLIHRINFSQNSRNNSNNLSSSQQQPTKAYVELVYISKKPKPKNDDDEEQQNNAEDDDNKDIELNDDNDQINLNHDEMIEERLTFKRIITKQGATINEFNEKRLDFKKYEEELAKIGVIVKARNFLVFQGDVTNIAGKTGKQLTKWFEQISGSDQYREEYERLRKEQEEIQNEFEGVNERNRNVAKEKKQMKQQKDEATAFQKAEEELEKIKCEYYKYQLYHIKKDTLLARESIANAEDKIEEENENLKELEQEIKLKQADLTKTLRKKTQITKNCRKLMQSLNKKKLKANAMEKEFASLKTQQNKLQNEKEELNEKTDQNDDSLKVLNKERKSVKKVLREYENELKTNDTNIELEENEYEIYQNVKDQILKETASLNTKKTNLTNVYVRKQDELDSVQNEFNILQQRQEKLSVNVEEIESNLALLKGEISNINDLYTETQKKCEQRRKRTAKLNEERNVINEELNGLYNELKEMELGIADNGKQKEQYEVLQTLTKLFSGIYGRLCDLVDCRQKKFELAVNVGLGINNQAIIVQNKQIAMKCMQHMRKTRRGNFRFLPLNEIKVKNAPPQIRRFGGSSMPMMDVINFDEAIQRAVQFALSNTIVVDTIGEARDIRNNSQFNSAGIRIVSLDGSVIQPNGNISGGYFAKKNHRNFNLNDKAKKCKIRDELLSQLKVIDDELMSVDINGGDDDDDSKMDEYELENSLNELENKRKNKTFRLEMLKKQMTEKQTMLKALNKEIKTNKKSLKKKGKEAAIAKTERDECDEEVMKIENEIFGQYAQDLGVSTMREYEESKLKLIEERATKKREINGQMTEIENKLKFLTRKNEMNQDQIDEIDKNLKKIKRDIKEIEGKRLKKIKKEIENEEEEAKNEELRSDEIQKKTKEKRKIVSDKNKQIVAKKKEITAQHQEKSKCEGYIARLYQMEENILTEAKHQNVELKKQKKRKRKKSKSSKNKHKKNKKNKNKHRRKRRKKNDGSSSNEEESDDLDESEDEDMEQSDDNNDRMEVDGDSESEIDMEEAIMRRLEGIDLSEFDRQKYKNEDAMDEDGNDDGDDDEDDENEDVEQRKRWYLGQINEISSKIAELQPNMKALEQYKKLQNKHKDGRNEHSAMRKKVTNINDRVDNVREKRSKVLRECFDVIQKNIKKIYGELTKSKQYKNGGKAFLNIGGDMNPFDDEIVFNAMPPGKPWREMQQLSGGEKSVASLALLFAIHSFKQSPFFILDEIDAALDKSNVQKVSNFIIKKSKESKTQIIVISLKDKFFSNANSLIGVCKNRSDGMDSSQVLSIDLTKYDRKNNEQQQQQSNES